MALRLRLRAVPGVFHARGPLALFCGLATVLTLVAFSASCVASQTLIHDVWDEAVRRSGYPREAIHPPEIIEPPAASQHTPLPRDENNRVVVARYFPLSHQVRIYSRLALPMRRILLREFLLAIYFDHLSFQPIDVESLSEMDTAEDWVEQALDHPVPNPAR